MATFLFDKTIFGPVLSRRLGVSLGVNLLPNDTKVCTFDCIYCECGWNPKVALIKPKLPTRVEVRQKLELKLKELIQFNQQPDVITFAGNGEPTIHPEFGFIIDDTLELRDKYCPNARVAVLSNATMLHKSTVVNALKKIDDNILKLDAGSLDFINTVNLPNKTMDIDQLVRQLQKFEGKLIVQTMFLKGEHNGVKFDNTTPKEVELWMEQLAKIKPEKVMIYSIARDTPSNQLIKVEQKELNDIAAKIISTLNMKVEVA